MKCPCTLTVVSFLFEWLYFLIHLIDMLYLILVALYIKSILGYVDTETRFIEYNIVKVLAFPDKVRRLRFYTLCKFSFLWMIFGIVGLSAGSRVSWKKVDGSLRSVYRACRMVM